MISNLENTTGYRSFFVIFQDIVGLASTSLLRSSCQDLGLARTALVSSVCRAAAAHAPSAMVLAQFLLCVLTLGPAPAPAAPPSWNIPRWTLVSWPLPHAGLRIAGSRLRHPHPGGPAGSSRGECRIWQCDSRVPTRISSARRW